MDRRRASHRYTLVACFLGVAAIGLGVSGSGCSAQGEGDRCTYFVSPDPAVNGTDECQDGLVCYKAFNVETTGDYDRCCPADLAQATVPACQQGTLDGGCPSCGRDGGMDVTKMEGSSDSPSDVKQDTKTDAKSKDTSTDHPTDTSGDVTGESSTDATDGASSG